MRKLEQKKITFTNSEIFQISKHELNGTELTKKSISDINLSTIPFKADNHSKPYYYYKNTPNNNYYTNKYSENANINYRNHYNNKENYNSKSNAEVSIYDILPKNKTQNNNFDNFRPSNRNQEFESKQNNEYNSKVKETELKKNSEKKIKMSSFNILNSHYEGLCNFLIFSRNSTPFLINKSEYLFVKIKINF